MKMIKRDLNHQIEFGRHKMKYTAKSYIPNVVSDAVRVTSASDLADVVKAVIGEDMNVVENFVLVTLDGASKVIRAEMVYRGTLNQSLVHPRDIFRLALIDNAAGILIAHNHPSGTLEASRSDIQITTRLKEVSKMVGIELLDHLIMSESGFYSMSDEGLL